MKNNNEQNLSLNEWANRAYQASVEKGFYEHPVEVGTKLMLIVSELSEALEAHRKGRKANIECFGEFSDFNRPENDAFSFESTIKDTFEDEIADAVIHIFGLCGSMGIDLDWYVRNKMHYNSLREYKHGKEY